MIRVHHEDKSLGIILDSGLIELFPSFREETKTVALQIVEVDPKDREKHSQPPVIIYMKTEEAIDKLEMCLKIMRLKLKELQQVEKKIS